MADIDHGCAEIAPKCARCRHPLVWRKGRLFHPTVHASSPTVTGARPYFMDFRGGWLCPDCDARLLAEDAATEARPTVSAPR